MLHATIILWSLALSFAGASALPVKDWSVIPPISVPVLTRYITVAVTVLEQDEPVTLIGQLCASAAGKEIKVTVLLNNNPDWEPAFGVLYYYVTDEPSKGPSGALCNNYPGGKPGPNCTVKSWPSGNDIYVIAHAGQSEAVTFTLDAEISHQSRGKSGENSFKPAPLPIATVRKLDSPPTNVTIYLSEVVTIVTAQKIGYHKSALLTFTFCPNPRTGTVYQVQNTVSGTDGRSSYALYICNKLPCKVDNVDVIAHNGQQLPSNTVSTNSGTWKTLYALVVCWGGVWDPTMGEYLGQFVFSAHQK